MEETENKLSQAKLTLAHIEKYGSITSWEAIETYKMTRLSAIIKYLKNKGYPIDGAWEKDGTGKHWKRYFFKA